MRKSGLVLLMVTFLLVAMSLSAMDLVSIDDQEFSLIEIETKSAIGEELVVASGDYENVAEQAVPILHQDVEVMLVTILSEDIATIIIDGTDWKSGGMLATPAPT